MRIFKVLTIIFFLYLLAGFSQKAEAGIVGASNLQTITSCTPSSTIEFQWSTLVTDPGKNWSQYFKMGDSAEVKIDSIADKMSAPAYYWHKIFSSLPSGTTYNWSVRVHDDDFCAPWDTCDVTTNGTAVVSKNCDIALPTCNYTYSEWSSCIYGQQTRTVVSKTPNPCTGDPVLTQNCSTPEHVYDCAHRAPECSSTTYQNCKDFPYSYLGSCYPPKCAMDNTAGSDNTKWTQSCAWSNGDTPPVDYVKPADQVEVNYNQVDPPCNDGTDHNTNCASVNTALGLVNTKPSGFVTWILGFVLSLSGGILVILLILAGYRLMTSQGDPEKIKEARERVTSALIGLFFIIFSFIIYQFITSSVLNLPGF